MNKRIFSVFNRFNEMWSSGRIKRPLVILIGGYCGTGKSTIARELQGFLHSMAIIPTGIIRAVYYSLLEEKGEIFTCHTYDLYKYSNSDKDLFNNYFSQAKALFTPIVNILRFSKTERQNFIIEGNHIFPELKTLIEIKGVDCLDFYLILDDEKRLINNMQSITHRRFLNKKQIKTALKLNKFLTEKLSCQRNTFLFDDKTKILEYVADGLEKLMQTSKVRNQKAGKKTKRHRKLGT
jgi:2-phosphoglycerate kinase